jgi:hypothetical protein
MVISQELPGLLRIGSHPRDRVKFVIAQDAPPCPGLNHGTHEFDRGQLFGSCIDQIPHENCRATRVAPDPANVSIPQMREQGDQLVELPMDIADHVKGLVHLISAAARRQSASHAMTPLSASVRCEFSLTPHHPTLRCMQ